MYGGTPGDHEDTISVTPEGYQRLREELRALISERWALAATLRETRADGGPPAENAGLMDALDDHYHLERRIATLRSDLARVRVVDGLPQSGAAIGSRVRLRPSDSDGESVDYMLVSSSRASQDAAGSRSPHPSVRRALAGTRVTPSRWTPRLVGSGSS
jgi:transcription elongation GreA/GreB family factor